MSTGHKPALPPDVLTTRDQQEIAELVQPTPTKRRRKQLHLTDSSTDPRSHPVTQHTSAERKNYSLRMTEEERGELAMILAQLRLQQRIRLPFNDFVILAIHAAKTKVQTLLASKEPVTREEVERKIQHS